MIYSSIGIIESHKEGFKSNWVIVKTDSEIARYYNSFFNFPIDLPARGPHITIIAGEKESLIFPINEFKYLDNTNVEFKYHNTVYTNGKAFWLEVFSEEINTIRVKHGLAHKQLHLTVGNVKNRK